MLSIIIVTYNGMKWLQKCLDSCKGYAVIVVDNGSTDQTVSFIKAQYPEIDVLPQNKNLGFGQANNLGISKALKNGAEHVFLLNQDAYIIDDCLERLVAFQKQNPKYGVLSPIHTNATQDRLDQNFSNYMKYKNNPDFYSDFVLSNKLKAVYEVPFVNAAAWLLSKDCLMTVGGFDPLFFHYGEDDNYCQRVNYHDLKIGVLPTSFVIHDRESRKTESVKEFSDAYFALKARAYNYKYANVNAVNSEKAIDKEVNRLKKLAIKGGLRFKISNYKGYSKQLKLLKMNKPAILKSIEINKVEGASYLS